ncbi:MAG: hypothetical protein J0L82_15410 [Deltaproteobacteria bacterium]|nr:hypothetical protein [Deltaproteobacteria bacterium]
MSDEKVSNDFLRMFDALLVIENSSDARELALNPDLLENLELHEADNDQQAAEVEDPSESK